MPTITLHDKTLHYQDHGQGPVLLFGHSFLCDSTMWTPQIKLLSKHYRCIVPELWDHGQSDHLPQIPYQLSDLANDYFALMQSLHIDSFAIIGLSVGGMWAVELALAHPSYVTGLVIMDTSVAAEPEATQTAYLALLDTIEQDKGFSDNLLNEVTPLFFSPYTLKHNPMLVQERRQWLQCIPSDNIPGIVKLGYTIFTRPCRIDALKTLTIPSLIIVGEDDVPRPVSESRTMANALPQGQLAIVPKAGHLANLENPSFVNQQLSDFLTSVHSQIVEPS